MPLRKAPAADLRRRQPLHALIGVALALAVVIAAFTVPVRASASGASFAQTTVPVELEVVPPTTQIAPPPPPPPAPPPPVEVPDEVTVEDIVDELVFDPLEEVAPPPGPPAPPTPPVIDSTPTLPPPTPPVIEDVPDEVFTAAEVQPVLVDGIGELQRRVEYPEFARRAGIEGQVVVQFVVDERGNVVDPVAVRSPNELLSEAAIKAVRESRFTPGQQRGRLVKVRFSVPVTFRLR
ncbi:energy transducer TonB [Rubrivirga sp. IMCC43871]|uniref:energy transducer TonB n=1 Tax=Rubrivirga sp. IMCC43871 TaxID=3391575 RepID=UPI00398FB257